LALGIAVTGAAFISPAFAEGTKQWAPSSSHFAALGAMETGSVNAVTYPFAGYDQPAERRLHIHIADPANEVVYIGLGNMTGNAGDTKTASYYWRIKAPDGTIVKTAAMAGGASSNITSHAQAVAGPDVLNAAGYSTAGNWTFDPATAGKGSGDYYIEFDIDNNAATVGTFPDTYAGQNYGNSSNLNINWFDITVASKGASPQAIDGRVWSKAWGVRTNDPAVYPTQPFGTPFNGRMFTFDGKFATKIDFQGSGLRPLQGQFSFNNTGTGTSGNKATDRKSVMNANNGTPGHKIFLNTPDPSVYPLTAAGTLENMPLEVASYDTPQVRVDATSAGKVEILLDFDNDGSFTANRDVRLFADVVAGSNQIPWNGRDGANAKVGRNAYPISTKIAYTQGETHFTAYDVEGLDNGFQVFTETSSGSTGPNLLFWDDSNITQQSGVSPTVLTNTDTGATTRQTWNYVSADWTTGYGNSNTINTWWFAYRDYQSTIINLDPTVELSVATASDNEANGGNLPTLLVSGTLLTAATVEVAFSGTATSGTDYTPASGPITITIPAGNYAATPFPIPGLAITDESVVEGDETLILTLQNPANIAINDTNSDSSVTAQSTYTIINDDFNSPPTGKNDAFTTPEDIKLNGNVLTDNGSGVDTDPDGDPLSVTTTPVTAPTHGTLTLNSNGTFTYTPALDYFGTDSFVYEITDGKGGKATATVSITITPVNDPPKITSTNNVTFAENGTGTALDVQSTDDGDAENAGLTYALLPAFDSALFNIDPITGKITFKTPPDYETPLDSNGDNAYILMTRVCDSESLCTDQVEVIVVTNVVETSPPSIISTVTRTPENQTFVADIAATDPDVSDTLTFSITGGTDAALFSIDPDTGELRFKAAPDFEQPADNGKDNVYNVTVMVQDNTAPDNTDSQSLKIVVTNINETPVISSNGGGSTADITHAENAAAVTTVVGTDVDAGDVMAYTITGGLDQSKFNINPATGELSFKVAPDFENPADSNVDNTYQVEVTVKDLAGLADVQTLNITVTDINDAPIITSNGSGDTADLHIAENTTAITTTTSTDQDGDTPTYSISGGEDAALFTIDPTTGTLTFKAAPDFENPTDVGTDNLYKVAITADDGKGGLDVQTLNITVDQINEAPVITSDGGSDTAALSVDENSTAATTVVGADPDAGDTLTYSLTGGVDASLFNINPSTGVLTFKNAPDFENPTDLAGGTALAGDNIYEVSVTVTDSKGSTDVQTLAVTVKDINDAPVITSDGGADTASVDAAENQTGVTTVVAEDQDVNDTPTFSISGGVDASLFAIDPSTGVLTFKNAPDFENPTDVAGGTSGVKDNAYEVDISVADGKGGTDVQKLTVRVTDANDAPIITSNAGGDSAALSVDENTSAVTTVTSTDQDSDTPIFSIGGGADQDKFTIDPATGVLRFSTAPDFEKPTDANGNNIYEVIVKVADGKGGTDEQALSITVLNVNDPPVITSNGAGDTAALTVNENQVTTTTVKASDDDGDTLTYSLSGGVDVALFAINNVTGKLVFAKAPDFENPLDSAGGTSAAGDNIYEVEIKTVDGKGGIDTQLLSITVADINEAPVITSNGGTTAATVHVPEEQPTATTVVATDEDTADTLHYAITGGADDHLFSIDPASGVLSFITVPDFEHPADAGADNKYIVEVTVNDGNGGYDVQTLSVIVDNVNDAPLITSNGGGDTARLTVPENDTAATVVMATDQDADTLSFSMAGGEDAALFSIDPTSGALTFLTAPDMENPTDANKDNTYLVNVKVDDGHGGSDTQTLEITISNTNESPAITSNGAGTTAALTQPENTLPVTTVTSTDPDGDTPAYSISGGADAALFSIDPSTGALSFTTAPDFENPADSGKDNVYEVEVTVTDGGGKTDTQALSITITDDRKVTLNVRAFLQGTYNSGTGLMADNLRTRGILPMAQPYAPAPLSHAGTEVLNLDLALVEGNNAIVDWILVDLRNAANPATILKTQAVMVQRDGDLVDAQSGSADLSFRDTLAGDYFVSVRHRNHLGVMTAAAVRLTDMASMVDFTLTTTPVYGSHARLEAGSKALLWAGDANQNQQLIANGQYNDINVVLGSVLVDKVNLDANSNFRLAGYLPTDLNLDGITLYAGPGNDINLLLGNVLLHPANSLFAANYIVQGTLPK
jgi:VCBS repeat-containing protein